ncbi:Dyp-type peroxidase [Corynebacterium genitalium ATCC 33030]|uniref:Tat-translocated enzyme n=1 Tax=Corynebacterium genitalium ATCC 33030 TaxID=585529 RepID=D7WB90_9CORY|nr:Dyp-type peroxidase [Corynebacterium genitalium]EFK55121.1 putative Tat-translocated enzyme [Corynebacterium genitalium ATCC 33030]UUA89612.1 Dyp-type peroxidase [Corynebacterium genitalium ATCC 33030]
MTDNPRPRAHQPTRRQFLHGAGVAGAAGMVAAGASACANEGGGEGGVDKPKDAWPGQGMGEEADAYLADSRVDFDGEHQAGVATPEQAFNKLIAFNLQDGKDSVEDARRLMRLWTDDARRMCSGLAGLADLEPENMVSTANLTITVGFGRSFLDKLGLDAPEWLGDLPAYSRDELREEWSGGDLCLQICADDRFTVSHAARFMTKTARNYVDTAWIQDGFLHARGSIEQGETPRNLFGQLDGSGNPPTDDFDDIVWISDGPAWLNGGTAMVVRRVAMLLDEWDILDRPSREVAVGRTLDTGAPLTGQDEFDEPDFDARDEYGLPVIDPNSHMARAFSDDPAERIFRRPYNYDMPPGPDSRGSSNAGQMFICFQKNPLQQFDPIQKRLDDADRLNEWITHIGSAVFAIPRGTRDGEYWGQHLLEG